MKKFIEIKQLLMVALQCATLGVALSGAAAYAADAASAKDVVLKNGDAKCTQCHNENYSSPVLALGKTKHGVRADARTPTCTSCHGESPTHINKPDGVNDRPKPDITFTKNSRTPAEVRNQACLSCHEKDAKRMFWQGSQHQARDIVCSSCHQVHTEHDKVKDKLTQPEVCFSCHKELQAFTNKPSHHPIPEGKMTCSNCHNPHGAPGPKQLVKDSVNATCYTCHAEKRGPFIHSHQPVTDDCTNCHNPHGTTADAMLKTRPPFLCLGCHDPSSHPGNVPGLAGRVDMSKNANGTVLSGTTPSDNNNSSGVVGKTQGLSCLNCHTDIHGSNNPMNSTRALRFWR